MENRYCPQSRGGGPQHVSTPVPASIPLPEHGPFVQDRLVSNNGHIGYLGGLQHFNRDINGPHTQQQSFGQCSSIPGVVADKRQHGAGASQFQASTNIVRGVHELNQYLHTSSASPSESSKSLSLQGASTRITRPLLDNMNRVLTADEVAHIFKTVHHFNTREDFCWAEGGSIFMFKPESVTQSSDWRKTGHIFRQGGGTTAIAPRTDPTMTLRKKTASLVTPEKKSGDARFKRYSREWEGRPLHVLIQFIGG